MTDSRQTTRRLPPRNWSLFALVTREELPRVQARLLAGLRESATLLPRHCLRFYPRVVKRTYSSFHRKRPGQQGFTLKKQSFRDILLI